MTKYFHLAHTVGNRVFPQSQDMISDVSIKAPNHLWNVQGKFPPDGYIPDSILHGRANFTDLISSSAIRLPIISDKLKSIIDNFSCSQFEFHRTTVIKKDKRVPYWIARPFTDGFEYVNFEQSEVIVINNLENYTKPTDINTIDGFNTALETVEYPETIVINRLFLKASVDDDMICVRRVNRGNPYLVSERLKNAIIAGGCTGIEFLSRNEDEESK